MDALRTWYTRKKALRNQLKQYRYMLEVHKITEMFITSQIIVTDSEKSKGGWRNELIKTQQTIKAHEAMIEFLTGLK